MGTTTIAVHGHDHVREEGCRWTGGVTLLVLLIITVPLFAQDLQHLSNTKNGSGMAIALRNRTPHQTTLQAEVGVVSAAENFNLPSTQAQVLAPSLEGLDEDPSGATTAVEQDDRRILTLFGGAVLPTGNGVGTSTVGAEALNPGFIIGADVGLRLGRNWRMVLNGTRGWVPSELSAVARQLGSSNDPPTNLLSCILGGLQYRAEGPARVKLHCEGLFGWMSIEHSAFALNGGNYLPIGYGPWMQNATSSTGFAYGAGVGSRIDRLSLMVRMVVGDLHYETTIRHVRNTVYELSEDNKV